MDYDAAWTRLFDQRVVAQDLFRLAVPALAAKLDFATMEALPTRWARARMAGDRPLTAYAPRTGDRAWRTWYDDGSGRSLILPAEFQSDPDSAMDVRSKEYALLAYQSERRHRPDADGGLRVLPTVVYSGGPRWAATDPAWAARRVDVSADGEALLPLQACAVLLDAQSPRRDDSSKPNVVAMLLELNAHPADAHDTLARLGAWLQATPADRRRILADELVDWMSVCLNPSPETATAVRRILTGEENANDMMAMARYAQELREEGRSEGHRSGQIELLAALTARRFGAVAAETLARRLADVRDAGALAEVGAWVVDCDTGAQLLDRVGSIVPKRPDGPNARGRKP